LLPVRRGVSLNELNIKLRLWDKRKLKENKENNGNLFVCLLHNSLIGDIWFPC